MPKGTGLESLFKLFVVVDNVADQSFFGANTGLAAYVGDDFQFDPGFWKIRFRFRIRGIAKPALFYHRAYCTFAGSQPAGNIDVFQRNPYGFFRPFQY